MTKLNLKISCQNLVGVSSESHPNPVVLVYALASHTGKPSWEYLWQTELQQRERNPTFSRILEYTPDSSLVELRFDVYDGYPASSIDDRRSSNQHKVRKTPTGHPAEPAENMIASTLFQIHIGDMSEGKVFKNILSNEADVQLDRQLIRSNAHLSVQTVRSPSPTTKRPRGSRSSLRRTHFVLGCKNLLSLKRLGDSKPMVAAYAQSSPEGEWRRVGCTELHESAHHPSFARVFQVALPEEGKGMKDVRVRCDVYLVDSRKHRNRDGLPPEERLLGYGYLRLGDAASKRTLAVKTVLKFPPSASRSKALQEWNSFVWLRLLAARPGTDSSLASLVSRKGRWVDVRVGARSLDSVRFLASKRMDPMAAVYFRRPREKTFRYLGKTEICHGSQSPRISASLLVS